MVGGGGRKSHGHKRNSGIRLAWHAKSARRRTPFVPARQGDFGASLLWDEYNFPLLCTEYLQIYALTTC